MVINSLLSGGTERLLSLVADVVDAGINAIQIREKYLDFDDQLELAKRLREITLDKSLLFINNQPEITRLANADGIQIPEHRISLVLREKRNLTTDQYFSCSVHSLKTAKSAVAMGADLLLVGTIFESTSHENLPPAGVNLIKRIKSETTIPIVGIGGIKASNAAHVMQSGASGVAVITEIINSSNPKIAARDLVKVVQDGWENRKTMNG